MVYPSLKRLYHYFYYCQYHLFTFVNNASLFLHTVTTFSFETHKVLPIADNAINTTGIPEDIKITPTPITPIPHNFYLMPAISNCFSFSDIRLHSSYPIFFNVLVISLDAPKC